MKNSIGKIIYIVLPIYNEGENLLSLLQKIVSLKQRLSMNHGAIVTVIAVDDGSTDNSQEVVSMFVHAIPVIQVTHQKNQGLGKTLRDGINKALSIGNDEDMVAIMDADDTHDPCLIDDMLERAMEGADVVIASRYRKGSGEIGVPLSRRFLSRIGNTMFRLFFRLAGVTDYSSGYRLIRISALRRVAKNTDAALFEKDGFACSAELLLNIGAYTPVVIDEVPLILRYDQKQGKSKMPPFQTIGEYFSLLIKAL